MSYGQTNCQIFTVYCFILPYTFFGQETNYCVQINAFSTFFNERWLYIVQSDMPGGEQLIVLCVTERDEMHLVAHFVKPSNRDDQLNMWLYSSVVASNHLISGRPATVPRQPYTQANSTGDPYTIQASLSLVASLNELFYIRILTVYHIIDQR